MINHELGSLWWGHLSKARWFSGKGRDGVLTRLRPLPWYSEPGAWPAVRSELAVMSYPNGESETYQLLAGYRPTEPASPIGRVDAAEIGLGEGSLWLSDAAADPEAIRVLLACQLAEATREGEHGGWSFVTPRPDGLHAELAPRPFGGEQSNKPGLRLAGGCSIPPLFAAACGYFPPG